ncbi:hypothetical protein Lferr_2627 [Acidithiobacillus ferrooxidans ATCC 53993]|nr:hypothetical protein Lferr_2627 [Acidithiobacillus ferrooxidans ATCC 53993]
MSICGNRLVVRAGVARYAFSVAALFSFTEGSKAGGL